MCSSVCALVCNHEDSPRASATGLNYQHRRTLTYFVFFQEPPEARSAWYYCPSTALLKVATAWEKSPTQRVKSSSLNVQGENAQSVCNTRSGSHSLAAPFKSRSLKLFGQIVRDVNRLVSKQPEIFFYGNCNVEQKLKLISVSLRPIITEPLCIRCCLLLCGDTRCGLEASLSWPVMVLL